MFIFDNSGVRKIKEFKYTHVVFIPFTPYQKKSVVVCVNCSKQYKTENQSAKRKDLAKSEQDKIPYPLWYLRSFILILIIGTYLTLFSIFFN